MKLIKPCSEGGMMSGTILVDETTDNNRFQGLLLQSPSDVENQ